MRRPCDRIACGKIAPIFPRWGRIRPKTLLRGPRSQTLALGGAPCRDVGAPCSTKSAKTFRENFYFHELHRAISLAYRFCTGCTGSVHVPVAWSPGDGLTIRGAIACPYRTSPHLDVSRIRTSSRLLSTGTIYLTVGPNFYTGDCHAASRHSSAKSRRVAPHEPRS
jgi:hypothetical protein